MCEKHDHGTTIEWCHYYTAVGDVESSIAKTNTVPRKEFQLAPINQTATSVLPSTFVDMLNSMPIIK